MKRAKSTLLMMLPRRPLTLPLYIHRNLFFFFLNQTLIIIEKVTALAGGAKDEKYTKLKKQPVSKLQV